MGLDEQKGPQWVGLDEKKVPEWGDFGTLGGLKILSAAKGSASYEFLEIVRLSAT